MIQKIEQKDIPGRVVRYNNEVTKDVLDFHKSDWSACEVSTGKYKNISSARGAYLRAVKSAKVAVIVTEREGRLFLLRK